MTVLALFPDPVSRTSSALLPSSLSGLIADIWPRLTPEGRKRLDEHQTQTERLLSDVFGDLPVWKLIGSDLLWARSSDVAELMEIGVNHIPERIGMALGRREIREDDVRRNVRDRDVQTRTTGETGSRLTESPAGVTMLSLRAIRRLAQTCYGERGVRFRDGLEAALDFAHDAERAIVGLLLTEQDRKPGRDLKADNAWARRLNAAARAAGEANRAGDHVVAAALIRAAAGLPELTDEERAHLGANVSPPVRRVTDPVCAAVDAYIAGRDTVTMSDILKHAGLTDGKAYVTRIGRFMVSLGWTRHRTSAPGRARVYRRPGA